MMLFLSLTFHSFIAGLVLGARQDMLTIFVAIIAHKGFASFALGCSFARTSATAVSTRAACGWIVAFGCVTPVGVLLGGLLSSFSESNALYSLTALAAGTFLYVGAVEVIAKEMGHSHASEAGGRVEERPILEVLLRLTALLLGFGLMALLGLWV